MPIKEIAYSAQQTLEASINGSVKRAHVYELLAAAHGFNSYAALSSDAVFTYRRLGYRVPATHGAYVRRRFMELGYPSEKADLVPIALEAFLAERKIGVVGISALIRQLRSNCFDTDDSAFDDDENQNDRVAEEWAENDGDDFPAILLEGLEAAASKDNSSAHYALALIHLPNHEEDAGSLHWYTQSQQGHELTGVKKEWAEAYAAQLIREEKHSHHLHQAGRLGNPEALLDLAEEFGDPSFFAQAHDKVDADPAHVAGIAGQLGRDADEKHWLTVAAESGDVEAMLCLIEGHDQNDLFRCWTWAYLSELVGTDLTRDAHYAINEDGSNYDDDVGGPMYVGGRDRINLDSLSAEQDAAAQDAAQELFDLIQQVTEQDSR